MGDQTPAEVVKDVCQAVAQRYGVNLDRIMAAAEIQNAVLNGLAEAGYLVVPRADLETFVASTWDVSDPDVMVKHLHAGLALRAALAAGTSSQEAQK